MSGGYKPNVISTIVDNPVLMNAVPSGYKPNVISTIVDVEYMLQPRVMAISQM